MRRVGDRALVVVALVIAAVPACSGKSTPAHAPDAQHLPPIYAETERARIWTTSRARSALQTAVIGGLAAGAAFGIASAIS